MGAMLSGMFGGGQAKKEKPPKDTEATKRQAAQIAFNRGDGLNSTNFSTMRQAYNQGLKTTLGQG